ncbi:hypothetical protein TREMEDRAFT_60607 [Tremella mesenterica DSM 1558]|uniref:uncharacterized protein n=1 Tax=Tremella mesenterica (strain ATCC 24925 / CBS 8224 / DSM 1558 / NBRC 9311 / NRRL Y-6157 / RJB 2259-6 / UBC 559-6) TaxID=578456 RepID=UPI0003F48EBB|nr:uncharacterized protein TREMEDRAFT_60607 [Tremella mesenterica DSM 1558]EIW71687.1 hypothetical protein TREMEDRAFT_60607 [Tremella mesenterica DSM 1558]
MSPACEQNVIMLRTRPRSRRQLSITVPPLPKRDYLVVPSVDATGRATPLVPTPKAHEVVQASRKVDDLTGRIKVKVDWWNGRETKREDKLNEGEVRESKLERTEIKERCLKSPFSLRATLHTPRNRLRERRILDPERIPTSATLPSGARRLRGLHILLWTIFGMVVMLSVVYVFLSPVCVRPSLSHVGVLLPSCDMGNRTDHTNHRPATVEVVMDSVGMEMYEEGSDDDENMNLENHEETIISIMNDGTEVSGTKVGDVMENGNLGLISAEEVADFLQEGW